jgi:hypothetical protein
VPRRVTLVQASFHLAARQKQWLPQTATLEQAARQVIHALRRDVLFYSHPLSIGD